MTEAESKTHKPRTTRPALDVLDHDQDRLLYHGHAHRDPPIRAISDGFRSHWEVLTWYQAAGIRTLGHVERVIEPRHPPALGPLRVPDRGPRDRRASTFGCGWLRR